MPFNLSQISRFAVLLSGLYLATSALMASLAIYDPLLFTAYHADMTMVLATYDIGTVRLLANAWMASAGILVACYAMNAVWLYMAAENARTMEPDPSRMEPGWVVAWFSVPVANLVMPFRGVRETWVSSIRPGSLKDRAPALLWVWWSAWVGAEVLSNVAFTLIHTDTMADAEMAVWLDVAGTPFLLVSGALWIWMVSAITQAQSAAEPLAAPA